MPAQCMLALCSALISSCMQGTGALSQKSEQKSAQEQMLTNPDLMSGMMKQNLSGIVPQVGYCLIICMYAALHSLHHMKHTPPATCRPLSL